MSKRNSFGKGEIMINFIKGELAEIREGFVTVEVGGIGYEISVPLSSVGKLPQLGKEVKLFTYLQVKEDLIALFGFLTREDLEVFKLLITVNGIGPRAALSILSSLTPSDLRFAVLAEDVKVIEKVPGIGKKTAAKLILELKDKFKLDQVFEERLSSVIADDINVAPNINSIKDETIQALTVLGYTPTEALKVVGQVEITEDMSSEDLLKLCLKRIV